MQSNIPCKERYSVTLVFSTGQRVPVSKGHMDLLCREAKLYYNKVNWPEELTPDELEKFVWTKPPYLGYSITLSLDNLIDVEVKDNFGYLNKTLERFAKYSVRVNEGRKGSVSHNTGQPKLSESYGHSLIKKQIVDILNSGGIEAYPEIVFYENAPPDFYKWQKQERLKRPNADGIFGYGNVGFGNYKPEYGRQIRVDVAGWVGEKVGRFDYPVIAVEVSMSSDIRKEINNLKELFSRSVVFASVIDAYGNLNGILNGIEVCSLEVFKKHVFAKVELVENAIREGKNILEIFEVGTKNNLGIR